MADQVGINFIYPPNFEGTFPPDSISGHRRYIVQLTCFSDGTGEEDVIKIRRTDLLGPYGVVPSSLVIEKIEYDVAGMTALIDWSANTDDRIAVFNNTNGCLDWTKSGGRYINDTNPTNDPEWGNIIINTTTDAFGTSDIDLPLTAPDPGSSYNMTFHLRTKE
uniref:Putative structural protein n=1 Tax=viral metagenome TaxID=1070528 RepID=A0A6M3IPG0_9ZZZZ